MGHLSRGLKVMERTHRFLRGEHFQRERHVQRSCGENKSAMFTSSSNEPRNVRWRERGESTGRARWSGSWSGQPSGRRGQDSSLPPSENGPLMGVN